MHLTWILHMLVFTCKNLTTWLADSILWGPGAICYESDRARTSNNPGLRRYSARRQRRHIM